MTRREWMRGLAAMAAVSPAACGKTAGGGAFEESTAAGPNPERGFYVQRAVESPGRFDDLRGRGISLVLLTVNLNGHRNRPLDDAKLALLDDAMRRIRKAGLKVIFRAAYGFTDADYRVDPTDLGLIRRHVREMADVLTKHAPWVFAVQAGMLGPWGEWHGSNHGVSPSLEARRAVMECWLDGLPPQVFLQVRRPMFLRDGGMDKDFRRIGWHNDALLANPDDMGTYVEPGWDRWRELTWCAENLGGVPFGGETVPDSESTPPDQVLRELALLGACYLNSNYHGGTLDRWRRENTPEGNLYQCVGRRLGYRIIARALNLTGDGVSGEIILQNTGFARPLCARRVELGLVGSGASATIAGIMMLDVVAGSWHAGKNIHLPFRFPVPIQGRSLALRIADAAPELIGDGRHSIRIMSKGVRFDDVGGWNVFPS
ncbi:MAG: DUF4874 domain-containing protein [Luteolibacter sp.]|jgi:hypothetical protein|nr:DUF4874 domain-containing protein [Luteolibacter sp.]